MTRDGDKPLTPQEARAKLQKGLLDSLMGIDSGPMVFRLKRTKKTSETYPLKLTQQQRETLLRYTHLSGGLKKKIAQAGEGTQIVGLTWNELHKLSDAAEEIAAYVKSTVSRRLMAVHARVSKFFEYEHAEVFGDEDMTARNKRRAKKSDLLYQFKIRLADIKPAIWRRIQVRDCTLTQFHEYIQAAFGWDGYHLHEFEIDGVSYSQPAPDGDDFGMVFNDEAQVVLSALLPNPAKRSHWSYEYDFGDGWRHDILFEGCPLLDPNTEYPLCVAGERACPPEDCGGPGGYTNYLAIIANPKHEEHEEMLEWRGPFDSEAFDSDQATKQMRRLKP